MKSAIVAFLSVVFAASPAWSQDSGTDLLVAANAGGTFTSANFNIEFTVGEFLTDTYSTSSTLLTQGFQQAQITQSSTDEGVASGTDPEYSDQELSVYPNPCIDKLTISYNLPSATDMTVDIYGITGNMLSGDTHTFSQGSIQYDLSSLPTGTYFIRIADINSDKFQVFKIQKISIR